MRNLGSRHRAWWILSWYSYFRIFLTVFYYWIRYSVSYYWRPKRSYLEIYRYRHVLDACKRRPVLYSTHINPILHALWMTPRILVIFESARILELYMYLFSKECKIWHFISARKQLKGLRTFVSYQWTLEICSLDLSYPIIWPLIYCYLTRNDLTSVRSLIFYHSSFHSLAFDPWKFTLL